MYFAVVAKSGVHDITAKDQSNEHEEVKDDSKKTSIWVYTSENHGTSIEVPLTPETTVLDVLECVRDPVRGEGYLVAVAGDTEYILQEGDNAFTFLYEIWNNSGSPLTFLLRYYSQQVEWPPPELEGTDIHRTVMATARLPRWKFHYDTYHDREEDWDIKTLSVVNAQLENYIRMLPGGAGDLTLAELQEMASRQQQQMEAQQQVLVAKEQRLKYLKQQEARHAQLASESERLRKIRERVESQELKLKKLRALKGQAEQYRANNGNLNTELDAVKAVFSEKEKELAMAVARVDQLTRQLKDLRNGVNNGVSGNKQAAAALELEKLRKELLIRNKLNEQQTNTIAAKEKLLSQRKEEVTKMDSRIHELQQRLKKRRSQEQAAAQHKANNGKSGNRPITAQNIISGDTRSPQIVVKDDTQSGGSANPDVWYQNVQVFPSGQVGVDLKLSKPQELNNNVDLIEEYTLPTVLPIDNNGSNIKNQASHSSSQPSHSSSQLTQSTTRSSFGKSNQVLPRPVIDNKNQPNTVSQPGKKEDPAIKGPGPKFPPAGVGRPHRPLVSLTGAGDGASHGKQSPSAGPHSGSSSHPIININEEERQAGSGQSSPASSEASNSSGGLQIKGDEVITSPIQPVSVLIEKLNKNNKQALGQFNVLSQATRSNFTQKGRLLSKDGQASVTSSDRPQGNAHNADLGLVQPNALGPDMAPSIGVDEVDSSRLAVDSSHVSAAHTNPSPHSPNSGLHLNQKPAPTYRYASKSQIANTYMGRLGSAAMDKYQKNLNMLYRNLDADSEKTNTDRETEGTTSFLHSHDTGASGAHGTAQFGVVSSPSYPDIASDKGSYKLNTPKHIRRRHSDSENEDLNKALQERQELEQQRSLEGQLQQQTFESPATEPIIKKSDSAPVSPDPPNVVPPSPVKDKSSAPSHPVAQPAGKDNKPTESPVPSLPASPPPTSPAVAPPDKAASPSKAEMVVRRGKSNLKQEGIRRSSNRVSFDPLALLLDASLEGELDLVKKVAVQVEDISTPNDEGITALHNAICAGHLDIVKFLVDFGCDVNSPDSDGWTPLHCAASCNNLPMVKFLVEHGACVFATTISDHETAADKCEEDEDGYDGCSDYLYSIQEKLGITNNGEVYGVFDYQATHTDEISFRIGDRLTVLRKGDDVEKEWWWSRLNGNEGYIPRNLLGLYPRVIPRQKDVSEC
ncbi:unnamed protein product [Lymnaea stagnalis]|uniref:SH3 domain-containing protein n=1 Tax=Lymnaea stagnalis TaxID=6523 RepID=A0AAV2H9D3_LYMST